MLISIGTAAPLLGVCPKTLRRWETKGYLIPARTRGNHRRYDYEALLQFRLTGSGCKIINRHCNPTLSHIDLR